MSLVQKVKGIRAISQIIIVVCTFLVLWQCWMLVAAFLLCDTMH